MRLPMRSPRSRSHRPLLSVLLALLAGHAAGCGGGGGGGGGQVVGLELEKPDGSVYISDPHQGGTASRLRLVEMFWARLVDVHDVDANGNPSTAPIFRDFAINEAVQSDGDKFTLSTNPITQRVRLVIRRTRGAPDDGRGTFSEILRQAQLGLAPIVPKHDDGSSSPPFSFTARNSALVLRFDDLLRDDAAALAALPATVRVRAGYPPTTPFQGRIFFDQNHGGVIGDAFHSTRVIVDCTVSEVEAAAFPIPLVPNSDGLPQSEPTSPQPNVSVRIPTRTSFGTGQFELLRGLSGATVSPDQNGPVDLTNPTRDVVRAMRSGNVQDTNNGFLLDVNAPSILGSWPIRIEAASPDVGGLDGFDWLVDLVFLSPCRDAPNTGDICQVGSNFIEVRSQAAAPDLNGRVRGVRVRSLLDDPLGSGFELVGVGELLTRFDETKPVDTGCWVTFSPAPRVLPQDEVDPEAEILVTFSEPMDPNSVSALETLLLVRGDASFADTAETIVPCAVDASVDLRRFGLRPLLPLRHQGTNELYHLTFGRITDLAGNTVPDAPEDVTFSIDPTAPPAANGGLVLRFNAIEEMPPAAGRDLRGQFFYDFTRGRIRPRPVSFQSVTADRTKPVPSIMIPFAPGVQTPLSPLGSKLHSVYRYCDLGWNVRDETRYNIDVVGLSWAPIGGRVVSDFYENFEIRLAHSRFLPDECINNRFLTPELRFSGLVGSGGQFVTNILNDPLSPQKIVHERSLGYSFSQANVFRSNTGVLMLPYPLNRGTGPLQSYTWRDTAVLSRAGPSGEGIPLCIEASRTLMLEAQSGTIAVQNQVPSFGLPLLAEYRCYPSTTGVGLNSLDISLAINSSALPAFRSYSTGGTNRLGNQERVEPDLEDQPRGGFNPNNNGRRTAWAGDNSFYIGQVDFVTRVSRVHTAWYDTRDDSPDYLVPVLLPSSDDQPNATQLVIEYRGATGFLPDVTPFDSGTLNAYGEPATPAGRQIDGSVTFLNGVATWTDEIDDVDGARYLQLRLSFLSSMESGLSPELDALAVAFSFD